MTVANSYDLWKKDAFFSAAEEVQESADMSATRILKKKKLKINVHRPVWTRVVFDEEGNTLAPLAMLADKTSGDILLDQDIEGVVDSISSSWKSQGLALFQSRVLFNVVFHGRLS
ncbi:DEAD-box ATP-dependent RNA helicase 32-like isoform X2 [Gossypium raimondii]|uniref:DEAD-box ATP-dependent RNA helicase 32-like isoform X2 n=1 Tax=Gossypium raimondii TaxID=29730 RepID=UPI00227D1B20|nr:DEAD-box ATP-dependent RNA helicase 32-like isoform X2 [Gossypium raimondii]